MGGLAAQFGLRGQPIVRASVASMLHRMPHRLVGDPAASVFGSVGLGTGGSTSSSQTRSDPTTTHGIAHHHGCAVVADIRLDNRTELIRRLALPDGPAASDADLVIFAYRAFGIEAPRWLLGDFAFALWDETQRTLLAVRDPCGSRPLFYAQVRGVVALASEIKALLGVDGVSDDLDHTRIADYLADHYDDQEATFFAHIRRVPPGHARMFADDRTSLHRYWELPKRGGTGRPSRDPGADGFRHVFEEAVRCRLPASHGGVLLSGGLDSASVACMAHHIEKSPPLALFTATFQDALESDERTFAESVSRHCGWPLLLVRGDDTGPLADTIRSLDLVDEPFFAPNLFLSRLLCAAAREAGVTVLLDGHDGDTAVGHGLGRLSELARRGRWLKLLRETRALSEHFAAFDRPLSRAWDYIRRDALAPALRTLHLRRALRPARRPRGLIAEELARRVGFEERRTVPPRPRDADEEHRRHFDQGLIGLGLELSERVAAAQGIEARHPFFDRRVVEYCATLPSQKKLSNGWTRLVMRKGMDGILPPDVQWRGGKADLGPNFSRSLLRLDGDELARTVADRETLAGIVDPVKLSRLHARVLEKPETPGARELWKVASLRAWLLRRGYAHGSSSDTRRTNPANPRS